MPVAKMFEDLRPRWLAILRKKNRQIGNLGKQSSVFPARSIGWHVQLRLSVFRWWRRWLEFLSVLGQGLE